MNKRQLELINFLIYMLIFFSIFKPNLPSFINMFCNVIASIASLIAGISYFIKFKKYPFSSIFLLYMLVLLFTTIINGNSIIFFFKTYLSMWCIIILTERAINNNYKSYFKYLNIFIFIMVFINLITILFPSIYSLSSYRISFLGYDNSFLPFVAMGNVVVIAINYLFHQKITIQTYIISILSLITLFIEESSNAKVAAYLLITLYLLLFFHIISNKTFNKFFNYKTYLALSIILVFFIVIYHIQDYFASFIVNVLHRSTNITGRTYIWERTLNYIKYKPLIGYGTADFEQRLLSFGIYHAHCTYLNVLLEGGIVGLTFYLNVLLCVIKKIKKYMNEKFVIILSFGTLIYYVMTIVEFYKQAHMFFVVLTLLYYSSHLINEENTKLKKIE